MFGRKLTVVPPAPSGRDRIRECIADRDAAVIELQKAQAATKRVRAVIDAANRADDLAEDARLDALDAAKRWAAAGADPTAVAERERTATAARTARALADDAAAIAAGARDGLQTILEAENQAHQEIEARERFLSEAIGSLYLAELMPQLRLMQKAAAEYRQAHHEVESLFAILDSRSPFAGMKYMNHDATQIIAPILEQAESDVRQPPGEYRETREDIKERRGHWESRAWKLRSDPNAE